jgi:hypothetical protein
MFADSHNYICMEDSTCEFFNLARRCQQAHHRPSWSGMKTAFPITIKSLTLSLCFSTYFSDNDLGLEKSLIDDLVGMDVVTVTAKRFDKLWKESAETVRIFQAVLGTPPNHPLIRRALQYIRVWLNGEIDIGYSLLGAYVVGRSMRELYDIATFEGNELHLHCKGVFLLQEDNLAARLPPGRVNDHGCKFGLVDTNDVLYGWSRVKHWGTSKTVSCLSESSDPEQVVCAHTEAMSGASAIPQRLLFNSKDGLEHEHILLQDNAKSLQNLFPRWEVISDNDETCLEKLLAIDDMEEAATEIEQWYTSNTTDDGHKREVCSLAQLETHGGVYIDHTVALQESLVNDLGAGVEVVAAIAIDSPYGIFRAILGTPPGHPITRSGLKYTRKWVIKTLQEPEKLDWMGSKLVARDILHSYKVNSFEDRLGLLSCKGVFLLKEDYRNSPRGRFNDHGCNIALSDPRGKHYGYSRIIKHWGNPNVATCMLDTTRP